jgi:putative addiction module component (TIGR02574 family)
LIFQSASRLPEASAPVTFAVMNIVSFSEILKLSISERIQLAEDIWDSIATEAEALPLTEAQCQELDHRLADAEANPGVGASWDEVKARLLGSA